MPDREYFHWPHPCNCDHTHSQLEAILQSLHQLHRKVDIMSEQQTQVDQDVQAVEGDVAAINEAVTAIQAEISGLQSANPGIDLSGLNSAVNDLANATAAVSAVPPAPAAPSA
jgi:septal ring factor EnvC (AmiA/AmiB activator)